MVARMGAEDEDLAAEPEEMQDQEPQAPSREQDASYWKRRYQEQERKLKRERKLGDLLRKYPTLSREDFEGIDVEHAERLAARLAGAGTAAQVDPEAASEQEAAKPPANEDVLAVATRTAGGSEPPPKPKVELPSAREALAKVKTGEWSEADYRSYLETKSRA